MTYKKRFRITIILILMSAFVTATAQHRGGTFVYGRVLSADGSGPVSATVTLKPTGRGSAAGPDGTYRISAPAGRYTLVASALGYERAEHTVELRRGQRLRLDVRLRPAAVSLGEVSVVAGGVSRVKNSSYNAVAVDARAMRNTTKTLSDALTKAPGMKLRESGGVGSDMQLMLDGFSGKHVKVFIDGVPQEGVGSSFALNNIPVNFADRIEVYRGVVPVGLGADAIGGVINVVTRKDRRRWYAGASYSYGSFNTHRSDVHFGQSTKGGLAYEVTAFQNYSDNDYCVDAPVYDFATHSINTRKLERVRRFNDTYHNEAVVAKVGFVGKPWADRLMLGFGYAHAYKDIQTGVRQKTVFGQKHRYGHSLMPSLEYSKRNAFVRGLNIVATANYNRNSTTNVDTAAYTYNWRGERERKGEGGEQSMLYARADADNWNATLTARYSPADGHLLTFNEVFNAFRRDNTSLLYGHEETNPIAKQTRKNIVAAASCLLARGLQAKISYEKAYRLPTTEEMFGDEDLETGSVLIRPENSDNVNLNLSFSRSFGRHSVYVEGSVIYRDTKDYIQRRIAGLSGNREGAFYENYGRVRTTGGSLSVRYSFGRWLSLGGNFTQMDVKDNERLMVGSQAVANPLYGARMPNVPYRFADADATLSWPGLGGRGNTLSLTYDNAYTHSFSYYSEGVAAVNGSDYIVPRQFAHNLSLAYSIASGRYNVSLECRNLTDTNLYDNFSLQKPGRAFYAKVRVSLGG